MERKTKLSLTICVVMALGILMPAQADNYFTMGVNNMVQVNPSEGYAIVPVMMHTNGRMNNWRITVTYPEGLQPMDGDQGRAVEPGADLSVTYRNYYDRDTVYNATLNVSTNFKTISSSIPVIGYFDYNHDGVMDPYGTVKWEAGDYNEMFVFRFEVSDTFKSGKVTLDSYFSSESDQRQGLISPNPCRSYTEIYFYVEYNPGDANGDGVVNITDVTQMVNSLLNGTQHDLIPVCDLNGDGKVNITDVTLLINLIMNE